MAKNTANARWQGSLKEGDGLIKLGNGAFEGKFSFKSRFEDGVGTNPEELIGAALAGCFTMQFNAFLYEEGIEPELVETAAEVTVRAVDGTPTITTIKLAATVDAPGADEDKIKATGESAKEKCIISRALAGVDDVELEVTVS